MYAPYRRLEVQGLDEDQQLESFFTMACVLERTQIQYIHDRGSTVKTGDDAYNSTIRHMDGQKGKLLDFQQQGRPLVLNFGSCTWAPYLAEMREFNKLAADYAGCVDFLSVYIQEMHASDSWKYEGNIDIKSHRSLSDRISAAEILQSKGLKTNLVCDEMSNESSNAYAAMPERLYVIQNNKVIFQGGTGPHDYSVSACKDFLEKHCRTPAA